MKWMTKAILIIYCLSIWLSSSSLAHANEIETEKMHQPVSQRDEYNKLKCSENYINSMETILPASLLVIEESAFEGTALNKIKLPYGIKKIQEYAFANILSLKNILIPDSITYLAQDVFTNSDQVIIAGFPKGYTQKWAGGNKIPLHPTNETIVFVKTSDLVKSLQNRGKVLIELYYEYTNGTIEKQNKYATIKINHMEYKEGYHFHVGSRAPPKMKV